MKNTWDVMKEILGKPKFKIKKFPKLRSAIDKKDIIDEKTVAKNFNHFL